MEDGAPDEKSGVESKDERPALRLVQARSPAAALGLAVNYLMTKPAFAEIPFGEWSRVLVGQINRGHYYLVFDRNDRVVGFLGWAFVSREIAEAWVTGRAGFSNDQARNGECVIFNAWGADSAQINRFVLNAARRVMKGKETVYFKRRYRDGGIRPVRVNVNDFVSRHIGEQPA